MAAATAAGFTQMAEPIKLGPEPQTFALRYMQAKPVGGGFDGKPRAMFTTFDNRKIFLSEEEASELEHALLEQDIRPGEHIAVARISVRGAGSSIRVARATNMRPQADARALESRSASPAAITSNSNAHQTSAPDARYAAAYHAAIDILIDAKNYAQTQGLAIEVRGEDVRQLAATIIIGGEQRGGAR